MTGEERDQSAMDYQDVAEPPTRSFVLLTGFLGQVLREFNRRQGLAADRPVDQFQLLIWLEQRTDPSAGKGGISNLESEIIRQRNDVLTHSQDAGSINLDQLRLWTVTHGAHELHLNEVFLADTIERLLSLKPHLTHGSTVD
jgi:hypothetical protein